VICGQPVFQPGTDDVITNPDDPRRGAVELDRGVRPRPEVAGYQRIASADDYLLVAQVEARSSNYRRNADGSWTYRAGVPGEQLALTGAERSRSMRSTRVCSSCRASDAARPPPTPR